MNSLITGAQANSIGPALTGEADAMQQQALATQHWNAIYDSRIDSAQVRQETALMVQQMKNNHAAELAATRGEAAQKVAEAKRGQADPAEILSLQAGISYPEAQARIQANHTGQPYGYQPQQVAANQPGGGPTRDVSMTPQAALTPQMRQGLIGTLMGNAYGPAAHGVAQVPGALAQGQVAQDIASGATDVTPGGAKEAAMKGVAPYGGGGNVNEFTGVETAHGRGANDSRAAQAAAANKRADNAPTADDRTRDKDTRAAAVARQALRDAQIDLQKKQDALLGRKANPAEQADIERSQRLIEQRQKEYNSLQSRSSGAGAKGKSLDDFYSGG